jgi:hypothetical protein
MRKGEATRPPSWGSWRVSQGPPGLAAVARMGVRVDRPLEQNMDFVKVLELAGKFTLLIAALSWFLEFRAREQARQDAVKAKHYLNSGLRNLAVHDCDRRMTSHNQPERSPR